MCAYSDTSSARKVTVDHFLSIEALNAPILLFAIAQDYVGSFPMTVKFNSTGERCKSMIYCHQLDTSVDLGFE